MSVIENTTQRLEGFETSLVNDDALVAEIRAHLRFTQRLGWIIFGFLFLLLCAVAFYFIAISL